MIVIEYLLIFLAGIVFSDYIIPLFDGLLKLILTWFEYPKQICSEKINESEARIKQTLSDSSNTVKKIGFVIEEDESNTEEEDTE